MDTCLLPSGPATELLLMPDDLRPMNFQWAFLFDLLSPEHRNPVDAEGQCFRNLVVGAPHAVIACVTTWYVYRGSAASCNTAYALEQHSAAHIEHSVGMWASLRFGSSLCFSNYHASK